MKKILCVIAVVFGMFVVASCGRNQSKPVMEEEAVAVDSTMVAVDSVAVDSVMVAE